MSLTFWNGWGNNMNGYDTALNIYFSPLVPQTWLITAFIVSLIFLGISVYKSKNFFWTRILTIAAFLLVLVNPSLLEEDRQSVKDVAVVVIDRSPSQDFGARTDKTNAALAYLQAQLGGRDDLDLRIIEAPEDPVLANETKLFESLDRVMADVPPQRRAGVIFLTDGQVHDVPKHEELFSQYGPVHVLLSGKKDEKDRHLKIIQAPSYGIVGQDIQLKFRIEDTGNIGEETALVSINQPDGTSRRYNVPVNKDHSIDLSIPHAGQNVFELNVQNVPNELTLANNRVAVVVNGVRDRLRVLLVSGKPHTGGRTWRDLLTSDPGVDLIHFTILREPDKLDATPQRELSLIAFPFRELFEIKLNEFDLVIFDRYQLNRILPASYFTNIVYYVERGGALLISAGPDFAGEESLYYTSLMSILPGAPTGEVIETPYLPNITAAGFKHPVTQNLQNPGNGNPAWGRWLRQISLNPASGDILMKGAGEKPLLLLDRVKEGRVAQIASDHIWLWSRGYEGGGPHRELLRRVVHWLMKEPELDEKALQLKIFKNQIRVESRNPDYPSMAVKMTRPDGSEENITLKEDENSVLKTTVDAEQLGVWSFEDPEGQIRYAVMGDINPPELSGVKTTAENLLPLTENSGGGIFYISENLMPAVRMTKHARRFSGQNWLALHQRGDYRVTGVKDRTLLPAWLAAIFLLTMAALTWWIEGRKQ